MSHDWQSTNTTPDYDETVIGRWGDHGLARRIYPTKIFE